MTSVAQWQLQAYRRGASGTQKLDFTAATLGFSQQFNNPWLTLRPFMELSAMHMDMKGESEQNAGTIGLDIQAESDTHTSFRPGLELGRQFSFNGGVSLHSYLRASVIHYFDNGEATVNSGLIGAPGQVESMRNSSYMGQNQSLFEAGLQYMDARGVSLRLQMERTVASHFETDQVSFKVMFPF